MEDYILLFLNRIGTTELLLILAVVVLLFGGRKIPEMMRGIGRGLREFKDAASKDYSSDENTEKSKSEDKKTDK